ncbi:MAG: LemA family protein [Acidobacteria bacterium]|nr:LemA family protein [Acidobacteriota bacterium]
MARTKSLLIGCIGLSAVLLIVLLLGAFVAAKFNRMVTLDEMVDNGWAQVENVLQRRGDLIPNLVETVKGYAAQERGIFENVAEARARLAGAASPAEAAAANAGLTSALGRLLAIAENYPQLKSNENFIRLQDELAGTENRIAVERRDYNDIVRQYNTYIQQFPNRLLAGMFGFGMREFFEAEEGARPVPQVDFTDE